ncbi:hypothetical protein HDU67_010148, partial [Dinochytrium kinnereticum]
MQPKAEAKAIAASTPLADHLPGTFADATNGSTLAAEGRDTEDVFEVSSIIAKLEQRMGRKRATSTPTQASQPEQPIEGTSQPSARLIRHPPPNRAFTSPALIPTITHNRPGVPAKLESEGTPNFIKVNGKWVETPSTKAFFMSATNVIDEEILEDVHAVLANDLVVARLVEGSDETSLPSVTMGPVAADAGHNKLHKEHTQSITLLLDDTKTSAFRKEVSATGGLETHETAGNSKQPGSSAMSKPSKPTVETRSTKDASSLSKSTPTPRSVKKTLPDQDLLLAELDAALQLSSSAISPPSTFSSFSPHLQSASSVSPSLGNHAIDVQPWFSSMVSTTSLAAPLPSSKISLPQESGKLRERNLPERSIAEFATQCSTAASCLKAASPSDGTSSIPSFKSGESEISLKDVRIEKGKEARITLSSQQGGSPVGPSYAISPKTEKDIQDLANSIDAMIRSKSKGSANSSSSDILALQKPIHFSDFGAMAGSMLSITSPSQPDLNVADDEGAYLSLSVNEEEDAFPTEEPRKPSVDVRQSSRAAKKRSAIAWSAKSVAKSMRESFADSPGINALKDDLEVMERLEDDEDTDEMVEDMTIAGLGILPARLTSSSTSTSPTSIICSPSRISPK